MAVIADFAGRLRSFILLPGAYGAYQLSGQGGPLQLTAFQFATGNALAPVLVSQRTLWLGGQDFNEVLAIPYPQ